MTECDEIFDATGRAGNPSNTPLLMRSCEDQRERYLDRTVMHYNIEGQVMRTNTHGRNHTQPGASGLVQPHPHPREETASVLAIISDPQFVKWS